MMTFAFDNRKHELVLSHCEGRVSHKVFQESLRLCQTASHVIFDFYRNSILKKFSKEL